MPHIRTAVAALVLAVSPLAHAAPCGGFTDVDDSNPAIVPFCASVDWIRNRGISLGCDQAQTLYCPSATVTRLQMAAFLYRLGFQNTFLQGGNAFGATAVLGTTDARPLELVVGGNRALRLVYVPQDALDDGINVTGGHPVNVVSRTCTGLGCLVGDPVRGGTIAGGGRNRVTDSWGFVGGGFLNTAGNDNATHDDADFAVVGGGRVNSASGTFSVVGGGNLNIASGEAATVPGGRGNEAAGDGSFAAGIGASANAVGCFVWADSVSAGGLVLDCNDPSLFIARARGGFQLRTNAALTAGCTIAAGGGTWNCSSSREIKVDFADADAPAILDRVVAMPISTWRYRDESSGALHLGPTSEDFREAFGLGHSSTEIGLIDGQGVALVAIQGLNAKLESVRAAKDAEIAALRAELAAIRSMLATIAADRPTQTAVVVP